MKICLSVKVCNEQITDFSLLCDLDSLFVAITFDLLCA